MGADATGMAMGVANGRSGVVNGVKKMVPTMFDKTDSVATPQVDANGYLYGGTSVEEEAALRKRYQDQQAAADARQLDWAQANQSRDQSQQARVGQSALSQSYADTIAGKNPSMARAQLYNGQQQNTQQGMAIAAGARGGGGNVLAAQRMAQRQAAMSGQATNRDAAMLRAQEVAAAQQGQNATLNSMRQGDAAQQQQDTGRQVQQTQLNDQRSALYQGAEQHAYDQKMAGSMAFQKDKAGLAARADEFNAGLAESDKERKNKLVGNLAGGASSGIMAAVL